ncbi:MAG: hypothetical protein Q9221_006744 [Calogaya cf. arnoldii]
MHELIYLQGEVNHGAPCAKCRGLTAFTDPSGWSRSLKDRETQPAPTLTATETTSQKRGSNWDGLLSNDPDANGEHAVDEARRRRGTAWDNTPAEDKEGQNIYGSTGSKKRRTAWDNPRVEDKRDALGPKVGQGGKPQPLYGNG